MHERLEHIDTILFDFDGTLADTLELGVKISNELANKYRYKQINTKDELKYYRSLSTQEALKAIGVSRVKLPLVASSFRKKLHSCIDELDIIDGMAGVIKSLSKSYQMGVVTSNSRKNIDQFLENHGIANHFEYYATGIRLFNKSKTIKSLLAKHRLSSDQVVLVGDETRDIETSKRLNIPIISVTWGFHKTELLEDYKPDFMVHNPEQLLELLV